MLEERMSKTDSMLAIIGGRLTEEQARRLILKKLYDLANSELNRYLNAEKRGLVQVVENLWDKYAVSSQELERERAETLKTLDEFLRGLGYVPKRVRRPESAIGGRDRPGMADILPAVKELDSICDPE